MKILLAGQAFYQHNNGQAVFTINLAEGLVKAGHTVMVLAPSETRHPYRKTQNGVTIQTVPTLPLKHNANVTAFSDRLATQVMAEFVPHVVHVQDHYFLSRSVLRATQPYAVKRIGSNVFMPENLADNLWLPAWLRQPFQQWLWQTMLQIFNQLDGVTTPTETAVEILRSVGLTVPLQAISCGVDTWHFRPRPELKPATMRDKYGLDAHKSLLLYVGRVDHEKCLDLVIKALALRKHLDLQFVIAGKGSHLSTLRALVQQLELTEQVIFTGFMPEQDLPLLLNSVDGFVMPSHAELQSIATLEAMASGLPILAANAHALPELVADGVNGYLFAADDVQDTATVIAKWLDHRSNWAAMGAASLEMVKPHATDNTIQGYLDWYQQIQPKRQPIDASWAPTFSKWGSWQALAPAKASVTMQQEK